MSSYSMGTLFQDNEDKVSEFEVWQGLANLYSSLSYWRDAEICLQKAKTLKTYSATTLHAEGEETFVTIHVSLVMPVPLATGDVLSLKCIVHVCLFVYLYVIINGY
jgi:hypothetical protein